MKKTLCVLCVAAITILSGCRSDTVYNDLSYFDTNCEPGEFLACDCEDGSQGEAVCNEDGLSVGVCDCPQPKEIPTGCNASGYEWGDPVLFACTNDLPLKEVSDSSWSQVLNVTLVNYRSVWNHIGEICIRNIGSGLTDSESLKVDVVNWALEALIIAGPFANGDKACINLPVTVGAQSQATFIVSLNPDLYSNSSHQFEITASADIVLDDDPSQPVVGDFPLQGDIVTIVSD